MNRNNYSLLLKNFISHLYTNNVQVHIVDSSSFGKVLNFKCAAKDVEAYFKKNTQYDYEQDVGIAYFKYTRSGILKIAVMTNVWQH